MKKKSVKSVPPSFMLKDSYRNLCAKYDLCWLANRHEHCYLKDP